MKPLPGLSVLVPALNEEGMLERVVRDLLAESLRLAREVEILIIDDGSTDGTPAIADRLAAADQRVRAIHHPKNLGFGATYRTGFLEAKQPFITLVPSDGQFPVTDLERYLGLADQADIVLGYRVNRGDGLLRRLQTAAFNRLIQALLNIPFKDVNWVQLYRRDAVAGIRIESKKVGVGPELLIKAMRGGAKVSEVEVSYLPRRTGVASSSRPSVILATIWEIFRLRWKLASGTLA